MNIVPCHEVKHGGPSFQDRTDQLSASKKNKPYGIKAVRLRQQYTTVFFIL